MKIQEVMILAGGLGTRLRSAVPNVPKVLAPVNNQPFLLHLIEFWVNQGIKKFVICTGYKGDQVKNEVMKSPYKNFVEISNEVKKLGTGGAILNGLELIKSDYFLVQNGDTFIPISLSEIYELKNFINRTVFMIFIKQQDINRYGLFSLNQNNEVSAVTINKRMKKFINGGIYIFNKKKIENNFFNTDEEISFENLILPLLIEKEEVTGSFFEKPFIDIGVPKDYKRAERFLNKHLK